MISRLQIADYRLQIIEETCRTGRQAKRNWFCGKYIISIIPAALMVLLFSTQVFALTGWNEYDARNATIITSTAYVRSGNKSIRLNGINGQQLYQQITGLAPGEIYNLNGYIKITAINPKGWTNDGLQIVISQNKYDTILAQTAYDTVTSGWQNFSIDAIAPQSGSVWVKIGLYGINSATVYVDDVWFGESTGTLAAGPGIAVEDTIDYGGSNAIIDSYDSTHGPYGPTNNGSDAIVATNSTGNSDFILYSNAKIKGNAKCGAGGNPTNVIKTYSGSQITGTRSALGADVDISVATEPTGPPFNGRPKGNLTLSSQTVTLNSNHYYNRIQLWGSTILRISGNVILLANHNVEISGSARIEILADSSLTLYARRNCDIGGKINVNTADPSKVHIYITGNNKYFDMWGDAEVHAVVENPRGRFAIWGTADFFGAIKAKDFEGGRPVHIDIANAFASSEVTGGGPGGSGSVLP